MEVFVIFSPSLIWHWNFVRFVEMCLNGTSLDDSGSNHGRGRKFLSSVKRPHQLWGPPFFLFIGYQRSSVRTKWPGLRVDHLPPCSAGVYLYHLSPYACMICAETSLPLPCTFSPNVIKLSNPTIMTLVYATHRI